MPERRSSAAERGSPRLERRSSPGTPVAAGSTVGIRARARLGAGAEERAEPFAKGVHARQVRSQATASCSAKKRAKKNAKAAKKTIASAPAIETPAICWSRIGESPHRPWRVDVEVVDRLGHERHHQPDRAREHEGGEEVGRLRAGAQRPVHDRPPEEEPGGEVEDMLEMEERVRVAERGVVDPGQVPDAVVDQPERERQQRWHPRRARGERRWDPEHRQERSPLSEHDVLDQVNREQEVERDRLDGSDRDGEQQHHRCEPARDPPAGRRYAPKRPEIRDREHRDEDERVRAPRPRIRIHPATLRDPRGCSSMVEP